MRFVAREISQEMLHAQLSDDATLTLLKACAGEPLTLNSAGTELAVVSIPHSTISTGNFTNNQGVAVGDSAIALHNVVINFYHINVTLTPEQATSAPTVTLPPPVDPADTSTQPPRTIPHLASRAEMLIGRDTELDALHERFQHICSTQTGQIVFITGKDGYGKSALLHSFLEELQDDEAHTDVARVLLRFWPTASMTFEEKTQLYADDPYLQHVAPLLPHVQRAWPQACADDSGEHFSWAMAQLAGALGYLPQPSTRVPDRLEALLPSIRQLARQRPLILACENLEYAPDVWIHFLQYLQPEIERDLPLLLLGTLRLQHPLEQLPDEEHGVIEGWAVELQKQPQAQLVWLDTVDIDAIHTWLGAADPRLAPRLMQLNAGVPYLIECWWQSWVDAGLIRQDDDGRCVVPPDEQRWVFGEQRDLAMRLLRLGLEREPILPEQQAMQVLQVASLEGPSFTAQVVAGVLGLDLDAVRDLLDESLLWTADFPEGMIDEIGYAEIEGLSTKELPNLYCFTSPHLQHIWQSYAPAQRVHGWQTALIAQLRSVYLRNPALIEERLLPLLEAVGDTKAASAIRQRWRADQSQRGMELEIFFLEQIAHGNNAAAYQLFEKRLELAKAYHDAGNYQHALRYAEAAHRQALKWQDELREARAASWMGGLLKAMGDLSAARPLYERALAIQERLLGPTHPNTATSLNNLGTLLQAMGELPAARPYYERALTIHEQVLGPLHPNTASSLNSLGYLLQAMGELSAARPFFERALAIAEQQLGSSHPHTKLYRENYQDLLEQLNAQQ